MVVNEDKLLHKDEVFVILNFKNTKLEWERLVS